MKLLNQAYKNRDQNYVGRSRNINSDQTHQMDCDSDNESVYCRDVDSDAEGSYYQDDSHNP